jgi:phenylacetate-CoA ligase
MISRQLHYDELETCDPHKRERELFAALPDQLAYAKANAPYFSERLAAIDARAVKTREALAMLPVTRKSDLHALQKLNMPFGGLTAVSPGSLARLFVSPGPIYDPEGRAVDYWGTARTLFAAGFRSGDIVHNTFSYHLTPAGSMFETGAHALGCAVIPAGVGQTEMQVATIEALKPVGYVGTPSFLKLLLEKADEMRADASSLRRALVSGEPFLAPVQALLKERGIDAYQAYGTADLGMIAYESPAHEGLIVSEKIILEIVRPGTGDPVAEGEVGEIVITTFNRDYPLLRFATGDLSASLPGISSCGRTNLRIKGWMGRADQTTKVRGMFVHPHQVAEIVKRHPDVAKARLIVSQVNGNDAMRLICESVAALNEESVEGSIREITKLRGDVEVVIPGTLPNDGKVIEDIRRYA